MAQVEQYYDKIMDNIASSKNELHLRTCSVMIGMFQMKFVEESSPVVQKEIKMLEVDLKNKLDEQAVRLGLLTV